MLAAGHEQEHADLDADDPLLTCPLCGHKSELSKMVASSDDLNVVFCSGINCGVAFRPANQLGHWPPNEG